MYLDLDGVVLLLIALSLAGIGAALWPTIAAGSRKAASALTIACAVIAAIVSVVD